MANKWNIQDMPLPARGFIRIEDSNSNEVARIYKPNVQAKYYGIKQLPEVTQANARLISAAPDMYEALIKLQQLKVSHSHSPIGAGKEANVWRQARKALAKAEGKDGK